MTFHLERGRVQYRPDESDDRGTPREIDVETDGNGLLHLQVTDGGICAARDPLDRDAAAALALRILVEVAPAAEINGIGAPLSDLHDRLHRQRWPRERGFRPRPARPNKQSPMRTS